MTDQPVDPAPAPQKTITLNLDPILGNLDLGVRRAATFVEIGNRPVAGDIPLDAEMAPLMRLQWGAEPLSEAAKAEAFAEYGAWITGNALKELDTFFHLYLDGIWTVLEYSDHGPVVRAAFSPSSIAGQTNSAKKMAQILTRLGDVNPDTGHLRNLTNARNVLTHQAGIVTREKAFHNGRLLVSWEAMVATFIDDQGREHHFDGQNVIELGDAAARQMRITYQPVERWFEVGDRIALTPHETVQICMFVQLKGRLLFDRVIERLREVGLVAAPGPEAALMPEPAPRPDAP